MIKLYSIIAIIILLIFLIKKLFNLPNKQENTPEPYNKKYFNSYKITVNNFQLCPSLLNSNEHVFFNQLKLAVADTYDIYPQVSLGAIFKPIKQWHNRGELSKLNKRIDFVLFDKNIQIPKIAIELDGYSHSQFKSFKRDEFVESIFKKFNIPLIRFNNGTYSVQDIKSKVLNTSI